MSQRPHQNGVRGRAPLCPLCVSLAVGPVSYQQNLSVDLSWAPQVTVPQPVAVITGVTTGLLSFRQEVSNHEP